MVKHELGSVHQNQITTDNDTRRGERARFISDDSFFRLFSNATDHCLDVSHYEFAEIVHDLCQAVPENLYEQFDFIFNWSCLDNIFDPATAMKNMSRMLRPGGRCLRVRGGYTGHHRSW